jgi:hypothetical protein
MPRRGHPRASPRQTAPIVRRHQALKVIQDGMQLIAEIGPFSAATQPGERPALAAPRTGARRAHPEQSPGDRRSQLALGRAGARPPPPTCLALPRPASPRVSALGSAGARAGVSYQQIGKLGKALRLTPSHIPGDISALCPFCPFQVVQCGGGLAGRRRGLRESLRCRAGWFLPAARPAKLQPVLCGPGRPGRPPYR